jgi:hypothetical protein
MLEHTGNTSSTSYIGITGISFHVSRLKNVGTKFPEITGLLKNRYVFTCITGEKTCLIEALLIANNEEEYKGLKG